MRYTYQYKTSDGVRHEGQIEAPSREAVFSTLKGKGVRPFNVELAPGFFNRVRSLGKRWFAIVVLVAALVGLGGYVLTRPAALADDPHGAMPRHQIYGDPALMAALEQSGCSNVFLSAGDRYLARYAQPGQPVVPEAGFDPKVLLDCRSSEISFGENDPREVVELKRIVLWMREELWAYLADGVGTPESFIKRLNQRQHEEVAIYNRLKAELGESADSAAFDRANASLRRLGLPTLLPPEKSAEDSSRKAIDRKR